MKEFLKYLRELLDTITAYQNSSDDQTKASLYAEVGKKTAEIENIYQKNEVEIKNRNHRTKFEKFDFALSLAPTLIAVSLTIFVFTFITTFKNQTASILSQTRLKDEILQNYELSARTLINSQRLNTDSSYFKTAIEFLNRGDSLKRELNRNQVPMSWELSASGGK